MMILDKVLMMITIIIITTTTTTTLDLKVCKLFFHPFHQQTLSALVLFWGRAQTTDEMMQPNQLYIPHNSCPCH
jgi:hypothetical protein